MPGSAQPTSWTSDSRFCQRLEGSEEDPLRDVGLSVPACPRGPAVGANPGETVALDEHLDRALGKLRRAPELKRLVPR